MKKIFRALHRNSIARGAHDRYLCILKVSNIYEYRPKEYEAKALGVILDLCIGFTRWRLKVKVCEMIFQILATNF